MSRSLDGSKTEDHAYPAAVLKGTSDLEVNLAEVHADMRSKLDRLLVIVGAIAFAGCVSIRPGYLEDEQKAAERAVVQFHSRLNNERYDEIYTDTSEEFRKTAERSDLIAVMKRTHEQFGDFKSSSKTNASVIMGVPRQVRLTYKASYEKGDAIEEFVWLVNFEEVKLASYRVSALTRNSGSRFSDGSILWPLVR